MATEKLPVYEIKYFRGALADDEDKGIQGAFKFGYNLDVRKKKDTLSAGQALIDIGVIAQSISVSMSPSASRSPSASASPSASPSISPSSSPSPSAGGSASLSPSASRSPSASLSPSASYSPSNSTSPSPSPSAGLKSVFSDLIRYWVKAPDGNTYGFGNTGKIYKIDRYQNPFLVYDQHQEIKGAEMKPSSGGKTYLIWATNTELHRKELPGRSDWNDVDKAGIVQGDTWPKTNLDSADWHTMKQVAGDVLIANNAKVAMSAYDDSYTNDALDVIPGNYIKTIVERSGRAVFGAYNATDITTGVNGAIDGELPLAQIGSDGGLYLQNFVDAVPLKHFPGGGKVNPGGVSNYIQDANFFEWDGTSLSYITKQNVGNLSFWGVYGATTGYGGVYSYGRKYKNHPDVLNLEYFLDVDEIGAVTVVSGITYVSYRSGSTFGVMITDNNNKARAVYEGLDFRAPIKPPEEVTNWKYAELKMLPLPQGCSVEFWYRTDKTGPFIQCKTVDDQNTYSVAGGKQATFKISGMGDIYEPRVVLNPSGNNTPEILRIRTFFL